MKKCYKWCKREFFHILPAFIFFFVSFTLINFTSSLILRTEGVMSPFGYVSILVASAVVAKILLIIDHMPFIEPFHRKPLIYNIIWKTGLYSLSALIVRFLDRLIPIMLKGHSFQDFIAIVHWPLFWAISVWYCLLFFVFVIFRELIYTVGISKVRRIFFGK